MKTVSLQDEHFAHSKNGYSCDYHPGKKVLWSRAIPYETNVTVFTGTKLYLCNSLRCRNKVNIAWLLEPMEIAPITYNYAIQKYKQFDYVLTHSIEVVKMLPNAIFMPYGDCWIKEEDWKMYDKTNNLCSIFCSEKKLTNQHILRHNCLSINLIDHFGYMNPLDSKLEGLKNYAFHVVVENSDRDAFFTEKLLDCFATGTIPIYCGMPSIGKFFYEDGMIRFSTLQELQIIIDKIKSGEINYEQFLSAAKLNYDSFPKYVRKDDRVLEILEEKGLV